MKMWRTLSRAETGRCCPPGPKQRISTARISPGCPTPVRLCPTGFWKESIRKIETKTLPCHSFWHNLIKYLKASDICSWKLESNSSSRVAASNWLMRGTWPPASWASLSSISVIFLWESCLRHPSPRPGVIPCSKVNHTKSLPACVIKLFEAFNFSNKTCNFWELMFYTLM